MRWPRLCSNAVVLLFVSVAPALAALPPATAPVAPTPSLFGTREIFHGDTSLFRPWTDMVARSRAEFAAIPSGCTRGTPACSRGEWSQLVAKLAPLPLREKVTLANAVLNGVPYVPATRNWGRANYWEAPLEFLAYGGQCQDYAIAKYMALRQAGVPAALMRVVVLRAMARGEDHAVLVVNVDGEELVLDNLRSGMVPANADTAYRPYYSINETGWWQHVAAAPLVAAR